MIFIHDLRHYVTLMKRNIRENEDGTFTESWSEADTVWAKIMPLTGREALGEGWENLHSPAQKFKVALRFRKGQSERIKWEDKILACLCPPVADERRRWMTYFMYAVS